LIRRSPWSNARGTAAGWVVLLVAAGLIAIPSLWTWAAAPAYPGPLEYGEGSVAHAGQLIARGADPYAQQPLGTFVAAIYPPVSYLVAAAGERFGPFVGLRIAALGATVTVAGLVAFATRRRSLAAIALGTAYLATLPVRGWAGAHRPDDLAVLFTAGAVLIAGPTWRRAAGAGALGALAIFTKQTAIVPLAFVLVYLLLWDRTAGRRLAAALGISVLALSLLSALVFGPRDVFDHVVGRNATEFSIDDALTFAALAIAAMGAFAFIAARVASGRMRAYLLGSIVVVLLAGRAGASINFELDLAAAALLGIATAPSLRQLGRGVPLLLAAQLVFVSAVTTFGPIRGAAAAIAAPPPSTTALTPGAHHLAEESGVLIAAGIEPEVDELFVWSHLVALGRFPDEVTPRVERGEFATITASAPLDELDVFPIQRQRWLPALVEAVLLRYRLESSGPGYYRYVPR
jgi:hypothetical protein